MNTLYYLQTCDTCRRIKKELLDKPSITWREIKSEPLQPEELNRLATKAGSYESIFNKRSRQLQASGIKASELTETDYRRLLNAHYSFLKRPLLETEKEVIVGSSTKAEADMKRLS